MAYFTASIQNTFRLQKRNPGLSLISILGIVLGHVVFFLILSYCWYEKSYDRFHQHADQIYRVTYSRYNQGVLEYNTANSFFPTGRYLKENNPRVANYTTIVRNYNIVVGFNNAQNQPVFFNEEKAYYAPSSFLSMFSFPVLKGNSKDLDLPNTVFITQNIATKYFGGFDPIGKTIKINGSTIYKIAGVLQDLPSNSSLKFNFIFSLQTHLNQLKSWIDVTNHWYGYDLFYTYVQLKDGVPTSTLANMLPLMVQKNYGEKLTGAKQKDIFAIQPITQIHLNSNLEWETEKPGNGDAVNILLGFSIFVLLVTWINNINLTTSQAANRAKEVGIRKVLGSSKTQVMLKYATETAIINSFCICLAAIALFIGYLLVSRPSPVFPVEIYQEVRFWEVVFGLVVFGILLTSVVPSLLISRFQPVQVLKGKLLITAQSLFLRKALMAFQFIVSFILITGSLIVYKQGNFLMNKSRGLDHAAVVAVKFPKVAVSGDEVNRQSAVFREKVKALNWVKDFTMTTDIPEREIETFGGMYRPQYGERDGKAYFRIGGDENYFRFFKVKLLAGRFFSKEMATDQSALILNESAVQKLGYQNPSQVIGLTVNGGKESKTIIGVVNDFHYRSVKVKPVATIFNYQKEDLSYFVIKLDPNDKLTKNHMDNLNTLYNNLFPGNPFEYVFLDDAMKQDLEPDLNFARIFGVFSTVSILISLIGLLGLVIVELSQRVKELGIRKVIGANFKDICVLMMKKFSGPLCIALLVGIPVSALGFSKWISGYYIYHINLNASYFLIPAFSLPLLAALVIILQVLQVNQQKIIKSLKHE